MSGIPESLAEVMNAETISFNNYGYAALSLYVYHYVATFSQEIEVVWNRQLTGVSILLLLNRYLPFISLIIRLSSGSSIAGLNQYAVCVQQYIWLLIALMMSQIIMAYLLALRVYAIWGQNWKCFVSVLALGLFSVAITMLYAYPASVYSEFPEVWGCWEDELHFLDPVYNSLNLASLIIVVVRDVLVLILTWIRTYEIRKLAVDAHVKTQLSSLLLRDGTVYFSINLLLDVLQMMAFADAAVPGPLSPGVKYIESAVQPMLLSHLMFDLREAYQSGTSSGPTIISVGHLHMTSARFTANVIGNMGAPLVEEWFDAGYYDKEEQQQPVMCDDPFAFDLVKDGGAIELTLKDNTAE